MQSVRVLGRVDRFRDDRRIDGTRQRELNEDAVDSVVSVSSSISLSSSASGVVSGRRCSTEFIPVRWQARCLPLM